MEDEELQKETKGSIGKQYYTITKAVGKDGLVGTILIVPFLLLFSNNILFCQSRLVEYRKPMQQLMLK